MQVTWRKERRRIGQGAERGASIACARGPMKIINARALKERVIMVVIHSGGEHHDRQIAIQRLQNDVFLNAYQADRSGASISNLMATIYS